MKNIERDIKFCHKLLQGIGDNSKKMLNCFKNHGKINKKQIKYFTYEYRKAIDLGNIYSLLKAYQSLSNVRSSLLQ